MLSKKDHQSDPVVGVENNSKFVRGKGKSRRHIENYCLFDFKPRKLQKNGWEYELTFQYTDDEDLESQIEELADEMKQTSETAS